MSDLDKERIKRIFGKRKIIQYVITALMLPILALLFFMRGDSEALIMGFPPMAVLAFIFIVIYSGFDHRFQLEMSGL